MLAEVAATFRHLPCTLGLSGLLALGLTRAARADDATPIDFVLDFEGTAGCPTAAVFEAALRARLPAARRIAVSEASQAFASLRLRLRAENSEIASHFPDGTGFRREVSDAPCGEAVESLAVIAAMALEANQRAISAASTAAVAPTAAGTSPAGEASVRAAPPANTEVAPRRRVATVRRVQTLPRYRWSALGSLGVASGVGPELAPEFGLGVELAQTERHGFSPSFRVSGFTAHGSTTEVGSAGVHFALWAGRFDFCPARATSLRVSLTACAEVELGQLRGSAENAAEARDQAMLWLGLGLLARAELSLSDFFAVEFGAAGHALPVHDRFILRPSTTVHQVPVIAANLLLSGRFDWR